MGPNQSSLKRTKRLTFPRIRRNSSCLAAFELDIDFLLVFWLKLHHRLILGLEPANLETKTAIGSCGSALLTADLRAHQPH